MNFHKSSSNNLKQKFEDVESNKNIDIYLKDNSGEQKSDTNKMNVSSTRKKIIKKKKILKNTTKINSNNNIEQSKEHNLDVIKEKIEDNKNNENHIVPDENKNIFGVYNLANSPLGTINESVDTTEKDLKNIYINNWLIYCFWCTSRKKNLNKILFEEGSKILTERLDILNMFQHLYVVEIMQTKLGIEPKGMKMSDKSVNNFQIYCSNIKKI